MIRENGESPSQGRKNMAGIFEVMMVLLFGASWPFAIAKSVRSRSTKGKSLLFMLLVWTGYLCGIVSKFVSGNLNYVVVFYILNTTLVAADILLYFRNRKLEQQAEAAEKAA